MITMIVILYICSVIVAIPVFQRFTYHASDGVFVLACIWPLIALVVGLWKLGEKIASSIGD